VPDLFAVLLIVLILVIIWRGPRTIPQIGAMLGRGVKAAREEASELRGDKSDADKPPTP
jgi:Sec-independent protein translocase protein TatA